MRTITKLLIVAGLLTGNAFAAAPFIPDAVGPSNGDLKWNGTIAEACNLQAFVDGTVTANINQTVMSSTFSGGAPASVMIRANANGYTLVLGTPQLIGSNGPVSDVSFNIDPIGNGTDLIGTVKGAFGANGNGVMKFDSGIYNVVVNGTATKNDGAFEAGTYVLRVPVTCVKRAQS